MKDIILPDQGNGNIPGQIYFANEDRFTTSTFSQPLTTYSVGWTDPENLQAALDWIAPAIPVSRRFEFKEAINNQVFLSETDDIRAIGSHFKRVQYDGKTVNEKTHNKGLTIRLDKDEMIDGDEERSVFRLMTRLLRNDLRRAHDALYAATVDSVIKAAWKDKAQPDDDLAEAIIAAGDIVGMDPNRLLIGSRPWLMRRRCYNAQAMAGAFAAAGMSVGDVADTLGLDGGRISKVRYQVTKDKKQQLVGNYAFLYFGDQSAGKDDPTTIKRFVTPSVPEGMRVFRHELDKFIDISVDHYSNIVVTSSLGATRLDISNS